MAKGKLLSEYEKGLIDILFSQGMSKRAISREIRRNFCSIHNYLTKPGNASHEKNRKKEDYK